MTLSSSRSPHNGPLNDVLALVDAMLGKEGLAVAAGYRHSPAQLDLAQRTAASFCHYDTTQHKTAISMLEAATGLGKTLAYLVALFSYAAVTGERGAISTHSRQLQRQIIDSDAQIVKGWVEELTGVSLSLARRIGRYNYVSASKVAHWLARLDAPDDADTLPESAVHAVLQQLADWLPSGSGVLDDFLQEQGIELPEGLMRTHITLDHNADEQDAQQYINDRQFSKEADIAVINHSLLVLHAFRWGALLDDKGDSRMIRAVVVDEAHKLPAVAESVLIDALSLTRFSTISRKMASKMDAPRWKAVVGAVDDLRDFLIHQAQSERYYPAKHIHGLHDRLTALMRLTEKATAPLLQQLQRVIGSGAGQDPTHDQNLMAEALDHAFDLTRIHQGFLNPDHGSPLVSWSPVKEYPSFSIGAPDAGKVMSRLWAPVEHQDGSEANDALPPRPRLNGIVFVSATLGAPGEPLPAAFDEFARQVGVIRHHNKHGEQVHNVLTSLFVRHEPNDFGQMQFVLADPGAPTPSRRIKMDRHEVMQVQTDPRWMAYSAEMLAGAVATGQRVLALTTSWRDTVQLANDVRELTPKGLIIEHRQGEPLRHALARYIQHDNAVLITPGGWEGVDLPGLVPNLFIHRVPFSPPDTDTKYRVALDLQQQGYSADAVKKIQQKRDNENVRQKLAQGIGRGIRKRDDACCVWIADPRFPMPADYRTGFDPEIEARFDAIKRITYRPHLLTAIPARFRDTTFRDAHLWLTEKGLYQPEGALV